VKVVSAQLPKLAKPPDTKSTAAAPAPSSGARLTDDPPSANPIECWDGTCWLQKIAGVWHVCCEVWCRSETGHVYLSHTRCEPT
jgi:hypothetical protein